MAKQAVYCIVASDGRSVKHRYQQNVWQTRDTTRFSFHPTHPQPPPTPSPPSASPPPPPQPPPPPPFFPLPYTLFAGLYVTPQRRLRVVTKRPRDGPANKLGGTGKMPLAIRKLPTGKALAIADIIPHPSGLIKSQSPGLIPDSGPISAPPIKAKGGFMCRNAYWDV